MAEQHSPQGAAPWVGEGWNMSLGSISWSEHQGADTCDATGNCTARWENTWQLSDPFGTGSTMIPPNVTLSTYYDDTINTYCGQSGSTYNCPVYWQLANDAHVKIVEYVGPYNTGGAGQAHVPCFRVWLQNGIMEEFGCTPDSEEYYLSSGAGQGNRMATWNLDLITDPNSNQIHLTYQQDIATGRDKLPYVRDAELATIAWDSPTCIGAQAAQVACATIPAATWSAARRRAPPCAAGRTAPGRSCAMSRRSGWPRGRTRRATPRRRRASCLYTVETSGERTAAVWRRAAMRRAAPRAR